MARLVGILHDAHGGLCRITAQNGHESAVGSEAVGIEAVEEDALLGYGVETYSHVFLCTYGWKQVACETFHHYKQDVWSMLACLIAENGVGVLVALAHHRTEYLVGFGCVHIAILVFEVLLSCHRLEKTEHRVYRRVVEVR